MKNHTFHIRQYPTADEELGGAAMVFAFAAVLFGILLIELYRGSISSGSILLAVIAGMLPVLTFSRLFSVAVQERSKRRKFMRDGRKGTGEIIAVREIRRAARTRHGERTVYRYVYTVRFTDGSGFDFDTQEYARPVHAVLATPYVTVYSDLTGRRHFIADFQVKNNTNEPGPFSYEGDGTRSFWQMHARTLYTILFMVFALAILLSNIRGQR